MGKTPFKVTRLRQRYFSVRGHYLKLFEDERKIEILSAFDLNTLALCTIQCSPPVITLHVEQNDVEDLTVRAESVDDARRWLKAFLVASPSCRVQFKGTMPTAHMSDGFTMEGAARYSTTSRDTKDDAKVEDKRFAI